jgi:hypothetical protein
MKLLHKRAYLKQEPWRDATLIFIICEGRQREPDYFGFFHQLDSRLKLVIIPPKDNKSAPNHLLENAREAVEKFNPDKGSYFLFIVMDTDRWGKRQIQEVWEDCAKKQEWNLALSNPCFEVWLYFHGNKKLPDDSSKSCTGWKQLVNQAFDGGFDSNKHPALIRSAIENAKTNYSETGYRPEPGSTQLYILGQKIYERTKNKL